MKTYQNILVVRTDRIGDVVLTTPAIKSLRQNFPKAKISILIASSTVDLVRGNSDLDEVLVDDRQGVHRGLLGWLKLIFQLKKRKYDLVVNFHTKKRTNLLCYLAGIPSRLGYKNDKLGGLLSCPVPDDRPLGKKHEVQYCLDLIQHLGVLQKTPALPFVPVQESAEEWLEIFLRKNNIGKQERLVIIHAGASDPAKRWPEKQFAEVAEYLLTRYSARIVLIGSEQTVRISQKVASLISREVLDVTGQTNVAQMVSLLNRSQGLISNDSGPVHVAAALNTPVVSIFTRNQPGINPERWAPLGEHARVVYPPQNMEISFKKSQPMDQKYLELIQTQEVLEAVDAVFKLC